MRTLAALLLPALVALALPAGGGEGAGAGPPPSRPESSAGTLREWTALTLTARKPPLVSATATLSRSEQAREGHSHPLLVFRTSSKASLLGAFGFEEETTSLIDRDRRRPLEMLQVRRGDSARRLEFLGDRVRQTTWDPPAGGDSTDLSDWTLKETTDRRPAFADGTLPAGEDPLIDVYSLIYLAGRIDLTSPRPAPAVFTTLYRRHLIRIEVLPGERRASRREAANETTGAIEMLALQERLLRLRPLGEEASSFRGLLGMQGDSEIWVDEESGALVEMNGQAPGFGATQVVLTGFRRGR